MLGTLWKMQYLLCSLINIYHYQQNFYIDFVDVLQPAKVSLVNIQVFITIFNIPLKNAGVS